MWITRVTCVGFTLFHLYTGGFGLLPDMRQRAVFVLFGFVITLSLFSPLKKRSSAETKIPVYDILLILLTLACCANAFVNYERYLINVGESTTMDLQGTGVERIGTDARSR